MCLLPEEKFLLAVRILGIDLPENQINTVVWLINAVVLPIIGVDLRNCTVDLEIQQGVLKNVAVKKSEYNSRMGIFQLLKNAN